MSKNDYIYSYVERKVIDERNSHTFDEKRYKPKRISNDKKSSFKALLFGATLGLLLLGIIIGRDLLLY